MLTLEQLYHTTELLSTEQYPSASCIMPLLFMVLNDVLNTEGDTMFVNTSKSIIKTGLTSRFTLPGDPGFVKTLPALAAFFDPRHKTLKFMKNEAEKKALHRQVISLAKGYEQPKEQEHSEELPEKRIKRSLIHCLDGDFSEVNEGVGIEAEIDRYIAEPVQIRNPLMWWNHYEKRFPTLAPLARKFLCVMGTSVPAERAFSAAGLTITKTRAKLAANVVEELIFLNKAISNSLPCLQVEEQQEVKIKEELSVSNIASCEEENAEEMDDCPILPCLY